MSDGKPNDFEQLRRIVDSEKPYSGEIREPANELDSIILDTITWGGNDNTYDQDPYVPKERLLSKAQRNPDQVREDEYHRLKFGKNFLTRQIDISEDTKLILAYNTRPTSALHASLLHTPQVVIDRFKPGGGLASRTKFNTSPDNHEEICKTQFTDFSRHRQVFTFSDYRYDFSRNLGSLEAQALKQLLRDPNNDSALTLAEGLISVNDEEKRFSEQKAAQDKISDEEYNAIQQRAMTGGLIIRSTIETGHNPDYEI